MALLIRGGMLLTMSGKVSFTGDVLIRDGRIARVAPCIEAQEDWREIDAGGLTVMPGLIDAHIHGPHDDPMHWADAAIAAGVTTGLGWPDHGGRCMMMRGGSCVGADVEILRLPELTGEQLDRRLAEAMSAGSQPICEVRSAEDGRRILSAVRSSGCRATLVHLSGCESLAEEIAASGCRVVIGVCRHWGNSPWRMAAQLDSMGVMVAVTCDYPSAMLKHLPVCAALCVRDGMPRERALRTITTNPASILGLRDAGQIASGFRADLVLYDGDPLLLASSRVMTICGGRICQR